MEDTKKTNLYYIDEHVARAVAGVVLVLTGIAVTTGSSIIFLLLLSDFALRSFTTVRSPLAYLGLKAVKIIGMTPKLVFAPPKQFAARLGLILTIVMSIFNSIDFTSGLYITALFLMICALLEAIFGLCLGCTLYNRLVVPIKHKLKLP